MITERIPIRESSPVMLVPLTKQQTGFQCGQKGRALDMWNEEIVIQIEGWLIERTTIKGEICFVLLQRDTARKECLEIGFQKGSVGCFLFWEDSNGERRNKKLNQVQELTVFNELLLIKAE